MDERRVESLLSAVHEDGDVIQSLLGYSMQFPFIGFVDGRDPKRLLRD